MISKHTKAGRHARRRAYCEGIAREAWGAYQRRRLVAWLRSHRGQAWTEREGDAVARDSGVTRVRLLAPPAGGLAAWEIVSWPTLPPRDVDESCDAFGLLHGRAHEAPGPVRGARSVRVPREDGAP